MLKKVLPFLFIVIVVAAYAQNVMWGDGIPVVKGNYIYYLSSVKNDDNTISMIWSESDEETRLIKYQKLTEDGVPVLTEPQIVRTSDIDLQNGDLCKSTNGDLFTILYEKTEESNGSFIQYLVKINDSGNVIWSNEVESTTLSRILPDDNGGCFFICDNIYHYNSQGLQDWMTDTLSLQSYEYEAIVMNNDLYIFYLVGEQGYITKIAVNGEFTWNDPIYLGHIEYLSFFSDISSLNNRIYISWWESGTNCQVIDSEGNLYNEDTLLGEFFNGDAEFIRVDSTMFLTLHQCYDFHVGKISDTGELIEYNNYVFPSGFLNIASNYILNLDGEYHGYSLSIYEVTEQGLNFQEPIIVENEVQLPVTAEISENSVNIIGKAIIENTLGLFSMNYYRDGSFSGNHYIAKDIQMSCSYKLYPEEDGLDMIWENYYEDNYSYNHMDYEGALTLPDGQFLELPGIEDYKIENIAKHNGYYYLCDYNSDDSILDLSLHIYDAQFNLIESLPLLNMDDAFIQQVFHTIDNGELFFLCSYVEFNDLNNNKLMIQKAEGLQTAWENPLIIDNVHQILDIQNNYILCDNYPEMTNTLYKFDADANYTYMIISDHSPNQISDFDNITFL